MKILLRAVLGLACYLLFLSLTRNQKQTKYTMSDPKRSIPSLIVAVIASLAAALGTQRANAEELAKVKQESDAKIAELEERLRQEDAEDAEIDELRNELEQVLLSAAAAKPPTPENISQADANLNAESPGEGQGGDTGDKEEVAQPSGDMKPMPSSIDTGGTKEE